MVKYTHVITGETFHMNKWESLVSDMFGRYRMMDFQKVFLRKTKK
jgi:hypothetical protein